MSTQSKTSKASLWAATMGAVATIIGGVLSVFLVNTAKIDEIKFNAEFAEVSALSTRQIEKEIESLKSKVATITVVSEDVAVASKLSELETKMNSLSSDIAIINKVIMQSPEKALEIPILKRDLASLNKQYEATVEALEREITRAYDTIKWVIGTIVLGILGLAASIFIKARDDE